MNSNNLQFQIDRLRKDKIIYAVEACAVILLSMFLFIFCMMYLASPLKEIVHTILLLVSVGYTLYMGVGNFFRLKKIRELEKKLFN